MTTPVVFAIGPVDAPTETLVHQYLLGQRHAGSIASSAGIVVVECAVECVSGLLALLGDVPYVASAGTSQTTEQALRALQRHWSRREHPVWHANCDWFQAYKHEFRAGEFVVIQESECKLRTHSKKEGYAFLQAHGNSDTLFHEMAADGVEILYSI
jgi:Uri superfamily endonuclease